MRFDTQPQQAEGGLGCQQGLEGSIRRGWAVSALCPFSMLRKLMAGPWGVVIYNLPFEPWRLCLPVAASCQD